MKTIKISNNYRIKIPKEIRKSLNIVKGQELQIFAFDKRIEILPIEPIEDAKGLLKGMNSDIKRDNYRI